MNYNRITKFEKARIIGVRSNMIAMGSAPMIDMSNFSSSDPIKIALEEFKQNKIPMIINRTFPNGNVSDVKLYKNKY